MNTKMGVNQNVRSLLLVGLTIAAVSSANAAVYTESISDSPSNFTCNSSKDVKSCYGYTILVPSTQKSTGTLLPGSSGAFYGGAGDIVAINLYYSSPLRVPAGTGPAIPGVRPYDLAYVDLYNFNGIGTAIADEPSSASSTVSGYVGPPGVLLNDTSEIYQDYIGFGLTTSPAFSITGMDSTITLTKGDPYPVVLLVYGYTATVPEPGSWAIMLTGLGLVGSATRMRRRSVTNASTASAS